MKDVVKSGRVAVWSVGDQFMIAAPIDATAEELADAMDAEEDLDKWRQRKGWN